MQFLTPRSCRDPSITKIVHVTTPRGRLRGGCEEHNDVGMVSTGGVSISSSTTLHRGMSAAVQPCTGGVSAAVQPCTGGVSAAVQPCTGGCQQRYCPATGECQQRYNPAPGERPQESHPHEVLVSPTHKLCMVLLQLITSTGENLTATTAAPTASHR